MPNLTSKIWIMTFGVIAITAAATGNLFAQNATPCALVCPFTTVLDPQKCTCVQQPPKTKSCALVCLGPDEVLDAKACRCVKR